jgi:poly(glycerol-phosphate) alpha-glucosyltransferase
MLDRWALANSAWRKRFAMALFERDHLMRAACIHALTQAEASDIRAAGFSAPIAVIPNGVDLPAAIIYPARRPMPKDGRRVLLFLGRLHPKKGIGPLCAAWGKVVAINPTIAETWRLVIAGWDDGGHLPEFRAAAAQSGAAESIDFCGPLYGAEKSAAYAHADAFILPSFSEGLPMTMLEAWAHSCAVFATASCNLPEGFRAGAAFPITTEPDEMAAVLAQALPDAERLASAGDAGRNDDTGRYGDGEEEQEAVAAHGLFVERHFGGGAPASAELLDRANRVWRQLPGAVVRSAGLVRPLRPEPDPEPDRTGDVR